jgi:hypothetical protein
MQEGHGKGHQDKRGNIISSGEYQSDFTSLNFKVEWAKMLVHKTQAVVRQMLERLRSRSDISEKTVVLELHKASVTRFYGSIGGASQYISHSACLCCLREQSQHPLPCGHVLCTRCVREHGEAKDNVVELKCCPLHPSDDGAFYPPWTIRVHPDLAGVRVLSLDG